MSPAVPFLDLAAINARFERDLQDALARVTRRGQWILGPELEAFERAFSAYCGVAHAVGVGNGLDALELTLRAWDIGPGDEVIVPGHTFIATWLAVTAVGARVVPVDPDPRSGLVGAAQIAPALGPHTRAVIPVHLYGRPAPMDEIMALVRPRGVRVLEDAAQAHGARLGVRRAGALGDAAAFSFYPAKNLGALGDGGLVSTDDASLAERLRALRNYGGARRYEHKLAGRNSRLDELQAAFLSAKLKTLDRDNARRAEIAGAYLRELDGLDGLVLPLPDSAVSTSAWHLFVVELDLRDAIAQRLAKNDIATLVHYPLPPHWQGAFAALQPAPQLPVSERLAGRVLSLPIGPTMDDGQVMRVAQAVRRAVATVPRATSGYR